MTFLSPKRKERAWYKAHRYKEREEAAGGRVLVPSLVGGGWLDHSFTARAGEHPRNLFPRDLSVG